VVGYMLSICKGPAPKGNKIKCKMVFISNPFWNFIKV
jgi:hypothetical protein